MFSNNPEERKVLYRDGISDHQSYLNGKREGYYTSWHENGWLHSQAFYRNDKLNGNGKVWYDNGQILKHQFYQDGKAEGKCRLWYINGNPMMSALYRNGETEGEYKFWTKKGELIIQKFYRNGNPSIPHFNKKKFFRLKRVYRNHSYLFESMMISDLAKLI